MQFEILPNGKWQYTLEIQQNGDVDSYKASLVHSTSIDTNDKHNDNLATASCKKNGYPNDAECGPEIQQKLLTKLPKLLFYICTDFVPGSRFGIM